METYKQTWLRIIKGLYKPYIDIEKWNDKEAYYGFKANYEIMEEAYNSIEDEPHIWVKNALDEFYTKWTNSMSELFLRGVKQ